MNAGRIRHRQTQVPKDAVLLIPEPDHNEAPCFGITPGYYDSKQLLQLLDQHKSDADAIQFIADMLETGDPEHDGFVGLLRKNRRDPLALARILKSCDS
jgi:hypothetical protein